MEKARHMNILRQAGYVLSNFSDKLRRYWGGVEEKHGNIIYGVLAITVVLFFGLVIYLLKGMVQFI